MLLEKTEQLTLSYKVAQVLENGGPITSADEGKSCRELSYRRFLAKQKNKSSPPNVQNTLSIKSGTIKRGHFT